MRKYKLALRVLEGRYAWMEQGILSLEEQLDRPGHTGVVAGHAEFGAANQPLVTH